MNIVIWMLAGGALGWAAYTYLSLSENRGMMLSVIVGAAGGFIGGNVIAPMFTAAPTPATAGDFSIPALFFAAAVAAAVLKIGDFVEDRWGI